MSFQTVLIDEDGDKILIEYNFVYKFLRVRKLHLYNAPFCFNILRGGEENTSMVKYLRNFLEMARILFRLNSKIFDYKCALH